MKRLLTLGMLALIVVCATAQTDTLRGHWLCKSAGVHLYLDLGAETLEVPHYEFLGKVNGYMRGNISDTWFLTTFRYEKDGTWTLRFSNDSGADTQEVRLQRAGGGALRYKAIGTNYVRRAVRKKWVYLPAEMDFEPV